MFILCIIQPWSEGLTVIRRSSAFADRANHGLEALSRPRLLDARGENREDQTERDAREARGAGQSRSDPLAEPFPASEASERRARTRDEPMLKLAPRALVGGAIEVQTLTSLTWLPPSLLVTSPLDQQWNARRPGSLSPA
jgi:hypothetical protein